MKQYSFQFNHGGGSNAGGDQDTAEAPVATPAAETADGKPAGEAAQDGE